MTIYTAPVEEMMFLFDNLKDNQRYKEIEKYKEINSELVKGILEEAAKINQELILPLAKSGDENPCVYENGVVRTPPGYKEVYKKFIEDGWTSLSCDPKYGGQGIPKTVSTFFEEMLSSSSLAFKLYSELSIGAYNCILTHAEQSIKDKFLPKIVEGKWSGTMCLTEPQCGTDLGLLKTKAVPKGNGTYEITGQKIFITSGDHDLTENIIHLVLARTTDAPKGTKGISLFLVPKFEVSDDGVVGSRNGVSTNSIESKMGIKGSPTCVLNFENSKGIMIGPENKGLNSMFTMMNLERIVVGVQGLGIAETAYQNAVAYSKERKQGKANNSKNGETDLIIKHADIRRSLMNMKSIIEGQRSFAFWLSQQIDVSLSHDDKDVRGDASNMVALLTPVIKSFFTDNGVEITNDAIQVFGGYGYTKDQGIEQLFRDNRITPIYEGTNSVQAIDLVYRKISSEGIFENFIKSMDNEIKNYKNEKNLESFLNIFEKYKEILVSFTKWMREKIKSNKDDASAACNDYLKVLGYTALAFAWIKTLKISFEKQNSNKEFYEDKINTGKYYFEKILPRAQSHYVVGTSGSHTTMSAKFN
ncbi:acyl-CoA dehydrogenase family protein [Candidatus Pelagibacter communis]|uniref:acyl-CoA dehydrogenase family protein n=1 Tax=Pelagibacter ubique TaxID=198252 RepID=UPI00094C2FBA|nr:acyl-CoA dehydrogenase family protein [Candidatus Pelagibacter ubique]